MIHIANPIYDSVFKYLMEDERVARTLLSALLKKEVVSVEMRRNEYANVGRRDISMFRIDFGAKVREADGRVHLVLIELQKTWLPRRRSASVSILVRNTATKKICSRRTLLPLAMPFLWWRSISWAIWWAISRSLSSM